MSADADRTACYDLTVATCYATDDGTATAAIGAFTADATMDRYGDVHAGTAAIRAVLAAREAQHDRVTCHAVTNFAYCRRNENAAEARFCLLVFLATGDCSQLAGVRQCRDVYRREGGRWLICHREQRYLGAA